MTELSPSLQFLITLSKTQSLLTRRFDGGLGGLSFSEFMILYHLSNAVDEKMRRIDLAGKVGLTASGVTRLLLPMEKIGLVKKETNPHDARVSYVILAPGGKRKLEEGLERAELLTQEIFERQDTKHLAEFLKLLTDLSGTIV